MKEEQITADYQRKRRELENDENILKNTQREGNQLIQKTLSDIYRIVQQSAVDSESFNRAKQAIMQIENDYREELSIAKKQVYLQQEELEQNYRKNLQKTDEE